MTPESNNYELPQSESVPTASASQLDSAPISNLAYNFFHDENMTDEAHRIFIEPFNDDCAFTVFAAYRYHKAKEHFPDDYLPLQDAWHGRILYPYRQVNNKRVPIPNVLREVIKRSFNRAIGGLDPLVDSKRYNLPQSCFGIYMSVDPKQLAKSMNRLMTDTCTTALQTSFSKQRQDQEKMQHFIYTPIEMQLISLLDKDKHYTWFHFETDTKDPLVFEYLDQKVIQEFKLPDPIIVETAHGYHFLWKIKLIEKLYQSLTTVLFEKCPQKEIVKKTRQGKLITKKDKLFTSHMNGRIPVPGTYQFGFPVKFTKMPNREKNTKS